MLPSVSDPSATPRTHITVSVVFARPHNIWQRTASMPIGCTVGQALAKLRTELPDEARDTEAVGIFGQRCDLSRVLQEGDRIEIYRPLIFDPLEARRRRAAHRQALANCPPGQRQRRRRTAPS